MAPQKQADGTFLMFKPEAESVAPIPFVVTERDTGAFVKALVVDLPAGKKLLGVSEYMTWPGWMKLWGDVNGVKAGFKPVSMEEYLKNVPESLKKELSESYLWNAEFTWYGRDPDVLKVEDVSSAFKYYSIYSLNEPANAR